TTTQMAAEPALAPTWLLAISMAGIGVLLCVWLVRRWSYGPAALALGLVLMAASFMTPVPERAGPVVPVVTLIGIIALDRPRLGPPRPRNPGAVEPDHPARRDCPAGDRHPRSRPPGRRRQRARRLRSPRRRPPPGPGRAPERQPLWRRAGRTLAGGGRRVRRGASRSAVARGGPRLRARPARHRGHPPRPRRGGGSRRG